MNIAEKLPIARRAIESISRHDDDDADVRRAALDQIEDFIAEERAAMAQRVALRLANLGLGPVPTAGAEA